MLGCDTSQCGACVVHIDGKAVKSCTVLVGQANGANVTTIEGISRGEELHPMQAAFRDNHGLQCGYCTPGMIMAAIDIVNRHGGKLDEDTVRHELEGNICRCTGYHNIVKSVLDAASSHEGRAGGGNNRRSQGDSGSSTSSKILAATCVRKSSGAAQAGH